MGGGGGGGGGGRGGGGGSKKQTIKKERDGLVIRGCNKGKYTIGRDATILIDRWET